MYRVVNLPQWQSAIVEEKTAEHIFVLPQETNVSFFSSLVVFATCFSQSVYFGLKAFYR